MINLILDALLGWLIDFIQILVEGVFGGDLSNIFSSFTDPSALQTTIPFINVLSNAMKAIGWIFLAINAYSIIIKALLSQFGGDGSTENPIKSMIKGFVAGFFIANQGSVMNLVSVLFGRISSLMPMEMVTINNLSWWFSTDPGKIFTRIILLVMVAFGVVGAALAYIERLFSFIIFLYTYPIAVAFSINKETSDTFRQWLQGIVSQMIMIVLSTGMMFIAITLLNKAMGDIWLKPGSPLDSPIGNLNIFLYVLALNAMSIVKNSEKILNMYNIRTMPNSDTAAGFAGAFQNAMRVGMFAVRSTMGAARGIGAVAGDYSSIGAASPMDGGSGGGHSEIINPMGTTGPIAPSDGPADNIARSATNKRISESQGQDYATRVSQPQTMGNVSKDSSTVDKLSLAMAQPPTNAQKMQEFHDRNMDHQGGRAKTSLGKMFQNGNDMANFDNFSKGADDAIKDINASRTKVNGWLEDQQNGEKAIEKSDGCDGVQPAFGSEGLKAEDVYKAYGMANDQSLKNFKPEGYAAPVFKNGKMSGMMIKGQQENARTGEISNKTMYVSSDAVQGDSSVGAEGEWTANTKGFHQVSPNAYAYELNPTKGGAGGKGESAELAEMQNNYRQKANDLMTFGYSRGNYPVQNDPRPNSMPEQPDHERLQDMLDNIRIPDSADTPTTTKVNEALSELNDEIKGEIAEERDETTKPTE